MGEEGGRRKGVDGRVGGGPGAFVDGECGRWWLTIRWDLRLQLLHPPAARENHVVTSGTPQNVHRGIGT